MALAKTADRATQLHLQDARDQIARILDPKFERPNVSPAGPPTGNGLTDDEEFVSPEICFPDYAIK